MSFMIGQSVIHPAHGAGTIVGFEEKELVKGFQRYFVIEFIRNRLTVHLPERRIEQIGVRPVMSARRISGVMETLESIPVDLPDEFRLRRALIDKQIHSGYPNQIAAAVRDLTWRSSAKYLTEADREALEEARALLITETALALEQVWEQAEQRIDEAIERAIHARQAEEARALEEPEPVSDWPMPAAVPADWCETSLLSATP
jgi:CarD family transcriptional regulator